MSGMIVLAALNNIHIYPSPQADIAWNTDTSLKTCILTLARKTDYAELMIINLK